MKEYTIFFSWRKGTDLATIAPLTDWIKNDTLKQNIKSELQWSISKSWKYLMLYNITNILTIILPASIPLIVDFRAYILYWNYIVTIAAFLSSVLAASAAALRVKELWQLYRYTAEAIKTECVLCSLSAGRYQDLSEENREAELGVTVERIKGEALKKWEAVYADSQGVSST